MENQKKILHFITGNANKFHEVQKRFKTEDLDLELRQADLDPLEIQADSIKDVAIFKLTQAREKLEGNCFVEDAGFFVDAPLNGFPGVYSSYVFKTIGNEGILKMIEDFGKTRAHFSAVIALYDASTEDVYTFVGTVEGRVSPVQRGSFGFGFDPIFIPNEIPHKTFAELTTEEKNAISHRGRAIDKLMNFLKKMA